MSSSSSNAAARRRRAGGPATVASQPQPTAVNNRINGSNIVSGNNEQNDAKKPLMTPAQMLITHEKRLNFMDEQLVDFLVNVEKNVDDRLTEKLSINNQSSVELNKLIKDVNEMQTLMISMQNMINKLSNRMDTLFKTDAINEVYESGEVPEVSSETVDNNEELTTVNDEDTVEVEDNN